MKTIRLFVILIIGGLFTSSTSAQTYLDMRQDGHIYDVDVVVFARQLSQPSADSVKNQALVKSDDVVTLTSWDGQQKLLEYPEISTPPNNTVPIETQANPVRVLSDVILSTSMDHAIVNRLKVNPTYRPILHQKWRQAPSAFRNPRYIQVSNLDEVNDQVDRQLTSNSTSYVTQNQNMANEMIQQIQTPDYSIDGQVAFSRQSYNHLHIKMNLFRKDSTGQQIIYQLSQQRRITLNQWQYFDHQQFGVLAKVTAVKLNQGE